MTEIPLFFGYPGDFNKPIRKHSMPKITKVKMSRAKQEQYCRQHCTKALGWNAEKRQECRENYMCLEFRQKLLSKDIDTVLESMKGKNLSSAGIAKIKAAFKALTLS